MSFHNNLRTLKQKKIILCLIFLSYFVYGVLFSLYYFLNVVLVMKFILPYLYKNNKAK
jgi:hypothetical protein